ncbi:hypothetical protein [Methylomagnum sp.]
MSASITRPRPQGLLTEQFFYFFLRLRKSEIRRIVKRAQELYPNESRRKLARRITHTQSLLSFTGGALLQLPQLFPGVGTVLKVAGLVGGSSMLTRMHLYLILEIAHLYGEDIEDRARVPEMMAVLAGVGVPAASPYLTGLLDWHPASAIPLSGLSASAVTLLIGEAAIRFYEGRAARRTATAPLEPMPAADRS